MQHIIFLAGLFTIHQTDAATQRLPNIGYLGRGYNLVKGNPEPVDAASVEDPGFESQVVQFTYDSSRTTTDGKYLIPDNTVAYRLPSCSFSSSESTYAGTTSYSDHLSQSISISGSYSSLLTSVSFSASASYQTIEQGTSSGQKIYQSANGFCAAYEAILEIGQFSLTTAFVQLVNDLPLTINTLNPQDPYYQLLNEYGTDYVKSIKMGSEYARTYEFSRDTWSTFQYREWNLDVTASVSYGMATGSASSATAQQKARAAEYDESASRIYITVLGSNPPTNGDVSQWEIDSITNPYPYYYELVSIANLFTHAFFPTITESIIKKKQELMVQALTTYCSKIGGCQSHQPDFNPQFIKVDTTHVQGTGTVTCRQGYTAISCAYSADFTDTEVFWSVWPENARECSAYNYFGATVYAVCVPDTVISQSNIRVVSESFGGVSDVSCPSNYKVTGCGYRSNFAGNEVWEKIYANGDGNSCHCYNYFGGTCYATCAANINQWQRYEQSGTGVLTVSCKGEAMLFGCGIDLTATDQGHEVFPAFHPSGALSCQGYSYFPYKLFAWCGSFAE